MAAERRSGPLAAPMLALVAATVVASYVLVFNGVSSPFALPVRPPAVAAAPPLLAAEEAASAPRLRDAFDRLGYRLDAVARGGAEVPPVFLPRVPTDMDDLPDSDTRKQVFLRVMLPLVLVVNEQILADRHRLQVIAERRQNGIFPTADETAWLKQLAARYGVEDREMDARRLLRRVDAVPPSLALAQAAAESGWGTSRLVRQENNLFGHTDGEGDHRAFASLHEAVRAYVHNLNTHRAYESLRRARAAARSRGAFPDGPTLATALSSYSERGQAYVDELRSLMRSNGLAKYDHARLAGKARGRAA